MKEDVKNIINYNEEQIKSLKKAIAYGKKMIKSSSTALWEKREYEQVNQRFEDNIRELKYHNKKLKYIYG